MSTYNNYVMDSSDETPTINNSSIQEIRNIQCSVSTKSVIFYDKMESTFVKQWIMFIRKPFRRDRVTGDNYECVLRAPQLELKASMCYVDGEPCTRNDQCCSGNCDPNYGYECSPSLQGVKSTLTSGHQANFCHIPGEPCDRNDQCCSGSCDLTGRLASAQHLNACHIPGEPCDRNDQCCSGSCDLTDRLTSIQQMNACHVPGEPCDRNDQCCSGRCDLAAAFQGPKLGHQMNACHHAGEPCDRQDQCCSGHCDLVGGLQSNPFTVQVEA
ncbi:hypothetical protein BDQ12DRAFT_671061 [Crucibulum laeve]|uniref:Uncharacterized protein n=1 Tax=Crucibulum laeve TaxID=68775 RepID=A0A5C3LI18_9AGAR|nr:hypothetical protein BDQ12DRAFT_671061 [Crucibulum laeve]